MSAGRLVGSIVLGCGAALGLFVLMERLVAPEEAVVLSKRADPVLEFVRLKNEPRVSETPRRSRPKPREETKPEPLSSPVRAQAETVAPQMPMTPHLPPLQRAGRFASGPALPAVTEGAGGDLSAPVGAGEELTPLVRINPLYPPHLRRMKIEGHVRAKLHVDTKGDVTGVEVMESEPQGRFDRTVLQALRRWKFRPKCVDGVNRPYTGVVTIEFKLVK